MSFDISKILLITDMDGTFLPASKVPGSRTIKAVERFQRAGGRFSIATGRAIQAAKQYFGLVRVNAPIIMSNGGMVYDINEKKQIYDVYLPQNAREITKEILSSHPWVGCEVLALEEVYVPQMTDLEEVHNQICKVVPLLCSVDEIGSKNWYKVLFALPPERMGELMSFVEDKGYKGVDFVRSSKEYYEILPQDISKGTALNVMRERCGMEDMFFIAAGDYNNDIELLQAADMAVCPSNAVDDVKAVCDKVYEASCEEDFIAEVIDDIMNGKIPQVRSE
ncbi:MAG: Cof-type HAD-IIB family hydrolase [Ruminococcus sp.]|nr:Cof-type HAD-IIB family hydrolase [Ruminococcus sp.]